MLPHNLPWNDASSDPLQDLLKMREYLGSEEYRAAMDMRRQEEAEYLSRRSEEVLSMQPNDHNPGDDNMIDLKFDPEEKPKKLRRVRDYIKDDEVLDPSKLHILAGLNQLGLHVYGGTVPGSVVEKRRAKNKAARKARRKNRR